MPHEPVNGDERKSLGSGDRVHDYMNEEESHLLTLVASGLSAGEVARRAGFAESEFAGRIRAIHSKLVTAGTACTVLAGLRQALQESEKR